MKRMLFSILLIAFVNVISAQSVKKINVPQVTPNSRLDKILEVGVSYLTPSKSCLLLHVRRNGQTFIYDLWANELSNSIIDLGIIRYDHSNRFYYSGNLRFFYYKKYIVFVSGENDTYGFFTKTNNSKSFNFLNSFSMASDAVDNDYNKKHLFINSYSYENNLFVSSLSNKTY